MVDVNTHFYGALVALAIVCILSILGSFIAWMNSFDSPEMIDNRHRWKWMVVVFMIVFISMLLGVKPNVT